MFTENYWQDKKNRRKFFENFAREKGFDPLDSHSWYSVSRNSILTHPVNLFILFFNFILEL